MGERHCLSVSRGGDVPGRGDVLMAVEEVELELGRRGVELRAGSGAGPVGQVADEGGNEAKAADGWTADVNAEEAVTRGDEEMAEAEGEMDDGAAEDMEVDEEVEAGQTETEQGGGGLFDEGIVGAVEEFMNVEMDVTL